MVHFLYIFYMITGHNVMEQESEGYIVIMGMERLHRIMQDMDLEAVLLTDGYNIHYLSGYRGHTGCLLVFRDKQYILTDSRYTEQVGIEAPDFVCVDIGMDGYALTIKRLLPCRLRLGFENNEISYCKFKAYSDTLGTGVEFVPLNGKIDRLREVKTQEEIARIATAEAIGDKAFSHILEYIRPGVSEMDVALELEYTMRKNGATGLSFDTIAASGPNSSLPHAVPTTRILEQGDFLTMDFGCIYDGYCSDMTRTVFIGEKPSEKQLLVYNTVLKAQLSALDMIRPGVKCSDVDACAREIIADAGYGAYFGHGLGHSVGLFIHEEPRFSRKCDDVLVPGIVITVEPGIYLPGEFGVRIEDTVVVTEDGYRNLAESPKELIML